MILSPRILLAALLISGLLGCAGKEFTRPEATALRNGETTYAQVIEKFGKPFAEGTLIRNDRTVRNATYVHSESAGKGAREGIVPSRSMSLYFLDDVLVGHEYLSSWASDSTDFDEGQRKYIEKGKTTEAELVQMLGKPSGYEIYPMIASKTDHAAVYAYAELDRGTLSRKAYRKVLVVSLDAAGIVTEFDYTSVGSK